MILRGTVCRNSAIAKYFIGVAAGAAILGLGLTAPAGAQGPVYNWTGFYLGGQAGGLFGLPALSNGCGDISEDMFEPVIPLRGVDPAAAPHDYSSDEIGGIVCNSSNSGNSSGFAGGVNAGADVQFSGGGVLGAVLDFNWVGSDMRDVEWSFDPDSGVASGTQGGPNYDLAYADQWSYGPLTNAPGTESSELGTALQEFSRSKTLDWYGTGRIRAGMAVGEQQRLLLAVSGGVAYGRVSYDWTKMAMYTPDEADRVFDDGGVADTIGEYHPDNETDTLPAACTNDAVYGADPNIQTGVACSWSGSGSAFRIGYALGLSGEYLVTPNLSFGLEGQYVNLGKGAGDHDTLDFWTVMANVKLRVHP